MTANIAAPGLRLAPRAVNALFGSDGSREAANVLVAGYRLPNKTLDLSGIALALKAMAKKNPQLAQNTFAEITSRLKPMRQGELIRLVGNSLTSPRATQQKLNTGQHILRGTSMASDTLHSAGTAAFKAKGAQKLAPWPAKIAFMTVDAKMKYDELRAKGFSHGAANAGMLAGQAASLGASGTGSVAGGWIGGAVTLWSGPGAIVGAGGGAVIGGVIGGGIDWALELSDNAALAAANQFDGTHKK